MFVKAASSLDILMFDPVLDAIQIPDALYQEFEHAALHDGLDIDSLGIPRKDLERRRMFSTIIKALITLGRWKAQTVSGRIVYFKYLAEAKPDQSKEELEPSILFRSAFSTVDQIMQYV
jgi:hypothetical protein